MLHNRAPILLPGGRSSIGRVPVRVVTSQPLSAAQMAELNGLYDAFYNNCQLSLARFHQVERTMSDGTEVRMLSNQGIDTVLVKVVQTDQDKWSAYPAYVDLSFTPVYDRPVVDKGGYQPPGCGDEPEFDVPPPPDVSVPLPYVVYSVTYGPLFKPNSEMDAYVRNETVRSLIVSGGEGHPSELPVLFELVGSLTYSEISGGFGHIRTNHHRQPGNVVSGPKGQGRNQGHK